MLQRLIESSLRLRLLVLTGLVLVVGLGVRAWLHVPVDAFPDVTPIQVSVMTESPGLAPEDVESLLTTPIESTLAGLPKVSSVRSMSIFGLSAVTVYFQDGTDIYFARQLVAERLRDAKAQIPEGFGEPELGPNASGLGQVFWYTVEDASQKLSAMELRTLQDWTIRLQLRTVAGVDDVTSMGGEERQYQVLLDPNKLVKYQLSLKTVMEALLANNRQVGGQFIDVGPERFLVRGMGRVKTLEQLAQLSVGRSEGALVRLRDIAELREGGGARVGAVTRDGHEAVLGIALQRIGENAKTVAAAVKSKLQDVQKTLPPGVRINTAYDRTDLVEHAVSTATRALLEGSVLVAIVLFLFLGEVRSALVVVLTLPLAMLFAFILMQATGLSANLMSLAGLAVAIGMMIDGAVVLVEHAYRELSHAAQERSRETRLEVVRRAAVEVAKPIAFAILIIVVVFLPLFSLSDIEGKMFKPMALAISFAMLGALVLTLTVTPVLSSLILRPGSGRDTWLLRQAQRLYTPLLDKSLAHKGRTLAMALVALVAALATLPFIGREFIPNLQEGAFLVRVGTIASTSLDESIAVSKKAEAALRGFPQTRTALATIGRAERGESEDVNRIEILVNLKDRADWPEALSYEELSQQMQQAIEKATPTAFVSMTQPIQMRVEELVSGVRAPLALRISGDDLAELDRLAARAKEVLEQVKGVIDLSLESNRGKPQISVTVRPEEAARYGLSVDEVLEMVQTGIGGRAAGVVLEGNRRIDIQLWLQPQFRDSVAAIASLPLRAGSGELLPLSRVADVAVAEGYAFVRHDDLQRNAVIQMDVQGRDVSGFVQEAETALARELKLPSGYAMHWGGSFENQQRAMARLAVIVPLTIGLIFILLYTAFNSAALAGLIIANVPFAMVGGVLALLVSGQYLSVPSAIGFIAVFGVAMLNGIVLVSFINEQLAKGKTIRDAVREGTLLRLRPVLMTASVAILGLLPMLLSRGAGAETQRPLAAVVIGGLISSTLLTLVLLPPMLEWLHTRRRRQDATEPASSGG